MIRLKIHSGHAFGVLLIAFLSLCSGAFGALTVSPSTIDNSFVGAITLNITGLGVAGQTVVVEEYLDADGSNSITAGDLLMKKFQVTDGPIPTIPAIGGHRNVNVPGDEDGVANSQIQTKFYFRPGDNVDMANGRYLFRVSPAGSGFTPFTANLTVTQKDYSGSGISGLVKAGGVGQPGAIVLFFNAGNLENDIVAATQAGSNGSYSMKLPAGKYIAVAWKSGFVGNLATAPVVNVSSGSFAINQNVTLTPRTRTISGTIRDSDSHVGLPGALVFATSNSGGVSLAFADASGNYTVDATDEPWSFELPELLMGVMGYLEARGYGDDSANSVTGYNIDLVKATSLIYGTIKTLAGVAVPFGKVEAESNGSPDYKTSSYSDAAGNYSLGVVPGSWQVRGDSNQRKILIKEQTVVVNTNDSAVKFDQTAHFVNAHLRGQIRDNHNNIVPNVEIIARDPTFNGDGEINAFGAADANGNFDLQVYGGGGTATQPWMLQLLETDRSPAEFVSTSPIFQVQDGVDINGITYLVYAVTAHLRGHVLDENDQPISHVNVYAASDNNNPGLLTGTDAQDDGSFDIRVFGAHWNLGLSNITGLGLLPQDMSVAVVDGVDQENLIFRAIHATGSITGTLKDGSDNPIGGINVTATASSGGSAFSLSTTTDSGGNYTFGVSAGTWTVSMDGEGLASAGFRQPADQNAFISDSTPVILNFVALAVNPGALYSGFDPNVSGGSGSVLAMAVQADGKLLIGGNFTMVGTTGCNNVARFLTDGTLDPDFDPGTGPDGTVKCIAVQADGKILIGGDFSNVGTQACHHLARLDTNGAAESTTTFNPGNIGTAGVNCIAIQRDGNILIGGGFSQIDSTQFNGIARLATDGTAEGTDTFNPGGGANDEIFSIAVQEDGQIVIGGNFTTVGNRIARLNPDGTVEDTSTFNPGLGADGIVYSVALQAQGKIVIGGAFTHVNNVAHGRIARLRADGSVEDSTTFDPGTGANDTVYSIAAQADGKIIIGGDFTQVGSTTSKRIASLDFTGFVQTAPDFDVGDGADGTVSGIALLGDGSVLVSGSFTLINQQPRNLIAALGNDVATQDLSVPDSGRVTWVRGGALPEVGDVTFELSTDDGSNWNLLGNGTRMVGGWQLADQDLPLGGIIRARGRTSGGYGSGSGGLVERTKVFSLGIPAPEIAVFAGTDADSPEIQSNGAAVDFGTIGLTTSTYQPYVIKNIGTANLNNLSVTLTGSDMSSFQAHTAGLSASLSPHSASTIYIQFNPKSTGAKSAVVHILSNDSDEASFNIPVTGTGAASVLPVATTTAASSIAIDSATLNGSVNAKGSSRDVSFEFGTTTQYGTFVPGTPSPLSSSVLTPVSAVVTGLLPHTKYNFRVWADGSLGFATGSNMTFTTADRSPSAVADGFAVLPGARAVLDVLTNDSDPDGDTLSIASFSMPQPSGSGTLAKVGNTLVFTASSSFSGATFTYSASDGFGGTSGTVPVTLSLGSCTIDPDNQHVASAGYSYPITVTATGAWSAVETLPWVSLTSASGTGDGEFFVFLQPNTSKTQRVGAIAIGGQTHTITQDGVLAPTLTTPPSIPDAAVSSFFLLPIETGNPPVTYTVSQLPPGLKMDNNTGVISGMPTKAGDYDVVVKATNAAGSATLPSFRITVQALSDGALGTFNGFVSRDDILNFGLGSRFELTTTATGSFTGKIITGTTTQALKGQLSVDAGDVNNPLLTLSIPRKGTTTLSLNLTLDALNNSLSGNIDDGGAGAASVEAWRNAWNGTNNKATAFSVPHSFSLEQTGSDSDPSLPQGYGFGSFTAKESTGVLTVMGKLADGNAFTTGTFVGQDGQVLIYQPLYGGKGSVAGVLTIVAGGTPADNTIIVGASDTMTWSKPPPLPKSKDNVYPDGFAPVDLIVEGGAYVAPGPGELVMGLSPFVGNNDDNADVDFSLGNLDSEFDVVFGVLNPSGTGLTNKTIVPVNLNKVNLPMLNATTGAFSGDFTIAGDTMALNRKVTFQGQIVNSSSGPVGRGFFLLPEIPSISGQTLMTSPKHSGRVLLQGN